MQLSKNTKDILLILFALLCIGFGGVFDELHN